MSIVVNPTCIGFEHVDFEVAGNQLFQNLSLRISFGGCTVLMGPAGSGKSTLLKIAAGLIPVNEGKVTFYGSDWNTLSETENLDLRSKMGFAFQNGALWANKTVYQNMELPLVLHRPQWKASQIRERIEQTSRLLNLDSQLALRPSQLSLGEQKLVSFLRAIVLEPEVIFLDDPTSSLDSQARELMLNLLEKERQKGVTLVLVTQDPNVTARLADYLMLLKNGQILAHSTFQEVTRRQEPEIVAILTSVLSQAATYSGDILDLLSIDQDEMKP